MSSKLSEIQVRPYSQLPEMNLGCLSLKDHFIATVGPYSGRGEQLKNLLVLADAKIHAAPIAPKLENRFPGPNRLEPSLVSVAFKIYRCLIF